jgi:hypothetical protein
MRRRSIPHSTTELGGSTIDLTGPYLEEEHAPEQEEHAAEEDAGRDGGGLGGADSPGAFHRVSAA